MAETIESRSEYPREFDDAKGSNFNDLQQAQLVNFYYHDVLVFHHIIEYNEFGIQIRKQIILDN